MKPNIALIGFMAAGKSTIGKELAHMLRWRSIDIDDQIRDTQKSSIPRLFETIGETGFRKLEAEAVQKIKNIQNAVISCGGGVVTNPSNMASLASHATIIYLQASEKTTLQRTKNDTSRPLLNEKKDLAPLYAEREPLYRAYADLIIQTDDRTPLVIAEDIISTLPESMRNALLAPTRGVRQETMECDNIKIASKEQD